MQHLIIRFWAICLMKAGPQDLPSSPFLAVAALVAYLGSGTTRLDKLSAVRTRNRHPSAMIR